MRETYQIYYRTYGCRFPETLFKMDHFKFDHFSKSALFHYTQHNGSANIQTDLPYFQGYAKKSFLENIFEYTAPEGLFRKPMVNILEMVRPWKTANIKQWVIKDQPYLEEKNQEVLVVSNYGYLDKLYKYIPNKMSVYWRWVNYTRTVYTNMNKIADSCDRNQFVLLKVPELLQGKTMLDRFSSKPMDLQGISIIGVSGEAGFLQLDFWKWLNPSTRKYSLLNLIDRANYKKINFIFQGKSGKTVLVNMAYFDSWIKGQTNITDLGSVIQFDSITIQKFFLKMCILLNNLLVDENFEGQAGQNTIIPTEPAVSEEVPEALQASDGTETEDFTTPKTDEESGIDISLKELDPEAEEELLPSSGFKPNKPITSNVKAELNELSSRIKEIDDLDKGKGKQQNKEPEAELLKELNDDIEALDRISLTQLKNTGVLSSSTTQTNIPEEEPDVVQYLQNLPTPDEVLNKHFKVLEPSDKLKSFIDEDAEAGLITAAEYRKLNDSIVKFNKSEDPYGTGQLRIEAAKIKLEDIELSQNLTEIPVGDEVPDKTMAKSSLAAYTKQYIRTGLKKDVLNVVSSFQNTGVIIKDHEVIEGNSILGAYEQHRIEFKPIDGAASSIQFTIPKIEEDGSFMYSGVKYIMRLQRVDIPIRKIEPRIVGLSSYYGKTFVQVNPKVANNTTNWIIRKINLAITQADGYIHSVTPGNVFDNEFDAPFIYNALAHNFSQFSAGEYRLFFNHKVKWGTEFSKEVIDKFTRDKRLFCGISQQNEPIVVDRNNRFFLLKDTGVDELGDIFELLQLNREKAPVEFSEVRVFSQYIPVGIVLGYYIGFKQLLSLLKVKYRIVEAKKNKKLLSNEFAIQFKDISLVFEDDQSVSSLIMAGFTEFDKITRLYNIALFEHKDVYLNLLMSKKIGAIYVREMDILENAFIDPITLGILEDMGEPTTFKGLLIRATQLLTTYHHPISQDRSVMRDRGYERIAGAVYSSVVKQIRNFRNRNLIGKSKIEMSPYEVINAIMKDNSIKIAEDINPIQNLKESEVITFAGTGGRNKESMTKPTRAFHKNDFGVLSESTVDSSAVGTIAYLSPNANIKDVRGLLKENKEINPTSVLSTAALISPAVLTDLPKRIMFVTTQHSHTIASSGYRQSPVLTGYEYIVGKRTGKLFSTMAEEDGVVEKLTPHGMVVAYANGKKVGIPLGRNYGRAEGTVYPHDIVSSLKPGDTFKRGDIIAYNSNFFEPSYSDPKNIIMKINRCVNVAFMESNSTHEDSSTISPRFSQLLGTEVTKVKSYVIRFTQNIHELKKPGEEVHPNDVLMIIEDEIAASHHQFSESSAEVLKRLSHSAPRANLQGIIERIEVFYHGDKDDMSPTLRTAVDASDNLLARQSKATGKPVISGRVTDEYRVSGKPLQIDTAEVRIYISVKAKTGVGDKLVFGHQMKSTVAEVHAEQIYTENGTEVDAVFSYKSVAARGVHSPVLLGTTVTLLSVLTKRVIQAYEGKT